MSASPQLVAADLFCGGGGFSKGFGLACERLGIKNVRLIAINHSQVAIESHRANHPWAEHHCARVDQLDPRKLVPDGRMKILIASPECTNHANARGGRPINDQSRATAWDVVKWAQELYIENIILENVREIQNWGPLGADGRPLKSKKGEIFRAWLAAIERCGYRLEHRILNAADYGDATTRKRFFLIAKRGNRKIYWPAQTHSKDAARSSDLFQRLKPWRGADEVIDFTKPSRSIFNRRKPLAQKTLERIAAGVAKYWGPLAEPFLVLLRGTAKDQVKASPRRVTDPLPTVTGGGIHAGLVQPFVLAVDHGSTNGSPRPTSEPMPTVITRDRLAVVQPFIITPGGADLPGGRSVKQPLPTVLCHERFGVVEPFVLQQQSGGAPRGVGKPLPSIATKGAQSVVQAFIVPFFGERDGQKPRTHSTTEPLPAVTSHGAGALVEPFLVKYHGTAKSGHSVRAPLPTVTGVERVGLVAGVVEIDGQRFGLDIRFRMLEADELARAMGFEGHEFKGTKKQKVLMIGNAVAVNQAEAICRAVLEN